MTLIIVIACMLSYLAVGSWTWGFVCARCASAYNLKHGYEAREPSYYHDEPEPWFAAFGWPGYFSYLVLKFLLGGGVLFLARAGENRGTKAYKARKLRIELEKRIRVEQEKIEQEAQAEIEEALRREEDALEEAVRREEAAYND